MGILIFANSKPTLSHDGANVLFDGRDGSNRIVCMVSKKALRSAYGLNDNPRAFISAFREHFEDIQQRAATKYAREFSGRPRVLESTAQELLAKDT